MVNLWERQPKEGSKRYEAFKRYRDLPYGEENACSRTLAKVAKELGKSPKLIERWSQEDAWVLRVQAYDDHMDNLAREAQERERVEMAKRHAKMGMLLQNKSLHKLQNLNPDELSPSQALQMLEQGLRTERLARGEPTENIGDKRSSTIQIIEVHEQTKKKNRS